MIRPNWHRVKSALQSAFPWHRRRELKQRPGHFSIRRKPILARIPWRKLCCQNRAAVAVFCAAALLGWSMMDSRTVGADAAQIVREVERSRPEAPPLPESASMRLEGRVAMMLQIAMLQDAIKRLDEVHSYTATWEKQERIDGTLSDLQKMNLKIRHEPFSVYFKVEEGGEVGREVLFPISGDDPRMLVQLMKFGGRLPALKLDPNSSLAMSEARYPITMAGIKEMTEMALEIRQQDLKRISKIRTSLRDDRTFAGRPVYAYTMEYPSQQISETYSRCEIYIDKELMLPVYAKNWGWVTGSADSGISEDSLIEYYAFKDVKLDASLNAEHFASSNPEYKFR
ncbi:DUF1571 domain-containing protein [bacterium]|nr:DUF1571 domain-containing protein [bacterium]